MFSMKIATQAQKTLVLRHTSPMVTGFLTLRYFACDPSTAGPDTLRSMREKLEKEFEPIKCEIVDPFGDQSSVDIIIVSEKFEGMLPLKRHRAINACLAEEIPKIHAVTI